MYKYLITIMAIISLSSFSQKSNITSIHQFIVTSIDGGTINFADFKGKKILVVNTASKCGFTYQYEGLEKLYQTYKDKLVIVGFPCNQFLAQDPGTNETINSFCKKNYGVTFPLAAKIHVRGKDKAPIYKWLCNKKENGVLDATITWNFNKFMLDEEGHLLEHFSSTTKPNSDKILKWLK